LRESLQEFLKRGIPPDNEKASLLGKLGDNLKIAAFKRE